MISKLSCLSKQLGLTVSSPEVAVAGLRVFPGLFPTSLQFWSALELQIVCSHSQVGCADESNLRTSLNIMYFDSFVVEMGLSF